MKLISIKNWHFLTGLVLFIGLNFLGRVNLLAIPVPVEYIQPFIAAIEGTVLDQEGEPLIGVNVLVKGTNQGTATDFDGHFTMENVDNGAVLVVSYVGYQTQEVPVAGKTNLTITLVSDSQLLDEVVVVGYGTQKKSKLVGSVSQIGAEQINNRPVTQVRQVLTGQLPGVTVIQRSGQPGNQGGSIQIRGVNSVQSDNAPLILVDGIPTPNFNDIDPNTIENVSVLKDASSAAIYGSRAANGVILVTTKTGSSKELRISYNGYVGNQRATEYPNFVNSYDYATLLNEANTNDGLSPAYTAEEIELFRNGSDPDNYPNVKFADEILKKGTLQTGHNLTMSNQVGSSSYMLSLGYMYQNGLLKENDYNRYNLRLNVVSELARTMKLTTRLSGKIISDDQPVGPAGFPGGGRMLAIIGQAVRFPSIYAARLSNGDWGGGFEQTGTPVSAMASDGFYNSNSKDFGANFSYDWEFIPNLTFRLIGGYTNVDSKSDVFFASQRLTTTNTAGPAQLNVNIFSEKYQTLQELLEYNKIFGDHEITALAGHTFEKSRFESVQSSRIGFPDNNITQLNAGSADGQSNNGTAREWSIDSYLGRLRYSFQNKYLVEGVMRYDGSSRFPKSKKYGLFPSIAAGWRISEENFMSGTKGVLDELKIKTSWGQVGAQALQGANGYYPYQDLIVSGFNYPFGNTVQTGVAATTINDPNLSWETTETYDIGLESFLFNRTLELNMTYFHKETFNLLLSPGSSISNVIGFNVGPSNSGRSQNTGLEVVLGYGKKFKEVDLRVKTNMTFLENKMLDLGAGNIQQPNGMVGDGSRFVGQPINLYYGLDAVGLFVDQQEIENSPDQTNVNAKPVPGDVKYRDISGPDGTPDGKVDLTYDRIVLGSQIPKFSYGFNFSVGYKGFTLSSLWQGVSGASGRLDNASGLAFVNQGGIQEWQKNERWTKENPNPNAGYPRLEIIPNGGTPNSLISSFWILNGNYLKMRNVQLSYAIPQNVIQKMGLNRMTIMFGGENLLSFHNYREGWDPEINATLNYYPIMANYTVSVNLNF